MKLKDRILKITCDGGAATGKSTGAKLVAKKYNLAFLSSGLLYRYAGYLILKQKPKIKKAMWSRRAQEYDQKINSGDIKQLSEVVRDLFRKDDQTEQSYSERQMFQVAFERYTREFAISSDLKFEEASSKILEILNKR